MDDLLEVVERMGILGLEEASQKVARFEHLVPIQIDGRLTARSSIQSLGSVHTSQNKLTTLC